MDIRNPIEYPLCVWRPDPAIIPSNFGDELFARICQQIVGKPLQQVPVGYDRPKFLAGGSVFHFARNKDVVWGAGIRDVSHQYNFSKIDIRAVRGPLTRAFLLKHRVDCPEVYGDPALLLPVLFPELKARSVKGRIGIVPHYLDVQYVPVLSSQFRVILPGWPPEQVVSEILQCEFVIASSLHGIIVAESFGIPARWVRFPGSQPEIKFEDYFLSTGREPRFAPSILKAIEAGGAEPIVFDHVPLLKAFPRDLTFSYV